MGRLTRIFLASFLISCWPGGWATAQDAPQDSEGAEPASQETATDERRVRRLGDVEGEEFSFDLAIPATTRDEPPAVETLPLGDPELEERLQKALGVLAVREGDRRARAEVDAVLQEVMDRAGRRMEAGDLTAARDLLNAVRQVEPNMPGLPVAWERLAQLQQPMEPRPETTAGAPSVAPAEPSISPRDTRADERSTEVGAFRLPNPAQAERLDQLLAMIAARPRHQAALSELDNLLDNVLAQAHVAIADEDFELAERLLAVVRSVNPRKRGLTDAVRSLEQGRNIADWLARAGAAEAQGQLIEPRLESAYYWYRRVQGLDPDNPDARRGLGDIQRVMVASAMEAAQEFDFELAEAWLEEAAAIQDDQLAVEEGRRQIRSFRDTTAAGFEAEVREAIRAGDRNLAEFRLIDLIALGGHEARVSELRALMEREEAYGQFEPGQIVQDPFGNRRGYAPPLVVVASGSFVMGSRDEEEERHESEGPAHRVTFERGFALGTHEVTVGQFGAFVRATGYRTEAERRGETSVWDEELGQLTDRKGINWRHDFAGRDAGDAMPVIHVSWNDARAYADWLSERTGERYRLPSEAEFEYALRAGTRTPYWWGEGRPRDEVENLAGEGDRSETGRQFSNVFRSYGDGHFGPAPVGSFPANPWGLHDLAGNVSEWTLDCWHASYVRAPTDGSAWDNPGCDRRVVRGGYWASAPRQSRSAARMSAPVNLRTPQVGFRVARDLW